jgi:ABC-type nitrate/sulfonate/bicarbonate transport system substrate-binding protein
MNRKHPTEHQRVLRAHQKATTCAKNRQERERLAKVASKIRGDLADNMPAEIAG